VTWRAHRTCGLRTYLFINLTSALTSEARDSCQPFFSFHHEEQLSTLSMALMEPNKWQSDEVYFLCRFSVQGNGPGAVSVLSLSYGFGRNPHPSLGLARLAFPPH